MDEDELLAAYPDHADRLHALLPALRLLGDAASSERRGVSPTCLDVELPAEPVGDFRLPQEVGRGGMGVVYEAIQLSLNRRVALKVLPFAATMDPRQLQRFRHEAQAAAMLHHPNIVPVHGVGYERGVHNYAMQLIEGRSLADLIAGRASERQPDVVSPVAGTCDYHVGLTLRRSPETSPVAALSTQKTRRDKAHCRRLAELIAQAADALEYAHAMGVVHRDIKLGNLMLDEGGNLWVTDFGLAKLETAVSMTLSGDLLGTLRYMSPEQALARHGLVDHRTDVYSLGATLYELLTLRPAVDGESKADILRHLAFEEPVALRKLDKAIPAELETIALKCLAKEPSERYATAGELAADLRRWLEQKPIKAKRMTQAQRVGRWSRRHPAWTATLSLTAGLLLAGAWAWRRQNAMADSTARNVAATAMSLRDQERYQEALTTARRAFDLLPRDGGDSGLRRELQDRVADLALLTRLNEARMERMNLGDLIPAHDPVPRASINDLTSFRIDPAASIARSVAAFRDEYGLEVLGGDQAAVVAELKRHAIRAQLVEAFDDLASETRIVSEGVRFFTLAAALDGNPNGVAHRWRTTCVTASLDDLRRLAADAITEKASPFLLTHIALRVDEQRECGFGDPSLA